MNSELERRFEQFKIEAINYIKANAPYRTGHLKHSIKLEAIDNGFAIVIDVEYMKYTEEAWTHNKRWGKTLNNKNYKWLQSSVERLAQRFAMNLKGVVVNG